MTPVSSSDVRDIAAGFDPDPALSMSLRAAAYTDPKWLDLETRAVFGRTWQWICHVEKLRAPGSYVAATVAGMPIAVVRDRPGRLRAFYNVCKHRAHELLSGSGTTRSIVCPCHAWVYELDGTLRGARLADRMPTFDASAIGRGAAGRAGAGPGGRDRVLGPRRRRPDVRPAADLRRPGPTGKT
jgi:choline monooxygenase